MLLTKQLSLQLPCFVSFFSFKRNKTGSHIGQAGIANSRGAESDLILLPPPLNCWSYQADITRPLQLPMTKIFLKALMGSDWITKGSPASYDLGRDCQVCNTVETQTRTVRELPRRILETERRGSSSSAPRMKQVPGLCKHLPQIYWVERERGR